MSLKWHFGEINLVFVFDALLQKRGRSYSVPLAHSTLMNLQIHQPSLSRRCNTCSGCGKTAWLSFSWVLPKESSRILSNVLFLGLLGTKISHVPCFSISENGCVWEQMGEDSGPYKELAMIKTTGRLGEFHAHFREVGKVMSTAQGWQSHLLSSYPGNWKSRFFLIKWDSSRPWWLFSGAHTGQLLVEHQLMKDFYEDFQNGQHGKKM